MKQEKPRGEKKAEKPPNLVGAAMHFKSNTGINNPTFTFSPDKNISQNLTYILKSQRYHCRAIPRRETTASDSKHRKVQGDTEILGRHVKHFR